METSAAAAAQGWSMLLEDLLVTAMSFMEVPDVVRSGAVCTSWRSAYAAFRALNLATPWQPPCLLYYARGGADDDSNFGTPTSLYSPSTNATFHLPLLDRIGGDIGNVIGSAYGWLLVTDKAANPYLLNPLTGARAALPPITTLERVKGGFLDVHGVIVYNVDYRWSEPRPDMRYVTAQRARKWMFHRAAISAIPSDDYPCVVLLVHMPYEFSFARPGDDRWTSLSGLLSPLERGYIKSVAYSEKKGVFYVLQAAGSLHVLHLNGPAPVARLYACTFSYYSSNRVDSKCRPYLIPLPSGGVLVMTRQWRRSGESPAERHNRNGSEAYMDKYVITTDIQLLEIHSDRCLVERPASPGDHALFLGRNSALYLPVQRLPVSLSTTRGCTYLTDDVDSNTFHSPMKRLDLGVWDFQSGSMQKLGDIWPLRPWLDCPAPIWITPSLIS
ncbi:hypothetical protein PR202_ga22000 [Eleusine coracana subsp. coracana]|uniref:KIB1-4 beta-propeller domain-containing protein n=1 Tax=Eleusine coracana subsp. coracana TaxID=191504 RepID=A0AAV5D346_ELECO|nr:hypothetical protein PR202_ga22000 [Eleusine coracana subsp. coracana]